MENEKKICNSLVESEPPYRVRWMCQGIGPGGMFVMKRRRGSSAKKD